MRSIKNIIRNYWPILGIFIFGVILYFYKLESVPSGFYIDEALPAYNAYSISKTLKDEYGKILPIVFRFYGSYNPPLYTYLTVFPVVAFGLNVFSARFISASAGVLSLFAIFLILKRSNILKSRMGPYLGTLLFVISPWMVLHSRVGYEISLAFLIFSFGTYFLWRSISESKFLVPAFFLLSLSTHAAYTERFIVPLLVIGVLVFFKKELFVKKAKRHLKKAVLLALLVQIPILSIVFTPAFFPKSDLLANSAILFQAEKISAFLPFGVSYALSFIREFSSQFVTYFSPESLFFLPDPDLQRSIPELSVFYFWMIIPYFSGIYVLWKKRKHKFVKFLVILAVVTPVAASLARDPFSTHRAIPALLPLILIIGVGLDSIISKFSRKFWVPVFSFLVAFSLLLLWRSYFVFLPKERAKVWGYGLSELAEEIKKRPETKFVIDQSRVKPSYINLAFFLEFPPEKFQGSVDSSIAENYYTNTDFDGYYSFGNIETRNIFWKEDVYKKEILVGDEYAISEEQAREHFLTKVFEIRDPIDNIIFVGFKTNPEKKREYEAKFPRF